MANINKLDLGTITALNRPSTETYGSINAVGGYRYYPHMGQTSERYILSGVLNAPTQATLDSLKNLQYSGVPVVIDLDDKYSDFVAWGKVADVDFSPRITSLVYYRIALNIIPSIGNTYIQTADAYLIDLDYIALKRKINPVWGRYDHEVSVDRLDYQYEFYISNRSGAPFEAVLEFQCGEDVDEFTVDGWKAAAWNQIGNWGNADAWNATKNWIDDNAIAHDFEADRGDRGTVIAFATGNYDVSQMLGLNQRILMRITAMQAAVAPVLSTKVGNDQLLLRVKIHHASREALRPYPVVHIIDGSVDYGPA